MKGFAPVVFLLLAAAAATALFLYWPAAAPSDSRSIAFEKSRLAGSLDQARVANDPVYARKFEMKLKDLDYLLAKAFIRENDPDAAIAVLQKLISDEVAGSNGLARRRYRSWMDEARYYEALRQSNRLKRENAEAERADQRRGEILARAQAAKNEEQLEEGRSIRLVYGD